MSNTISRFGKKAVIDTAAVALLLVVGALMFGENGNSAPAESPSAVSPARTVKVETLEIVPVPILDLLTLPGRTEAVHDIKLSAEREGRVEWIGPKEGESVTAEEPIAMIDLDALQAALDKARASYDLATKKTDRRVDLEGRGVLATEELDRARNELTAGKSDLRKAEVDFEQGTVRSPVAGVVNHLYVDPGEYVTKGAPVADVVDLSRIRVNVEVPEMDVRFIREGGRARVSVDAWPEREWLGEVDFVSRKADEATNTFKVRVVVKNNDDAIRPGMLARASFKRNFIPRGVAAPLFSIVNKGGERFLFVEENGTARSRAVTLGVVNRERVQILSGLEPGDRLIVTGQSMVEDGIPVDASPVSDSVGGTRQ